MMDKGSSKETWYSDPALKFLIGTCPQVKLLISLVEMSCILDTGAEVSTIAESFYNKYLKDKPLEDVTWLKVTAANGLEVPCIGYIETAVEILGKAIPKVGWMVIKDTDDDFMKDRKRKFPGIVGSNVFRLLEELWMDEEIQNSKSEERNKWLNVIRMVHVQEQNAINKRNAVAKVAGKTPKLIVSGEQTMVKCTTSRHIKGQVIVERLTSNLHLPKMVTMLDVCTQVENGMVEVPVINVRLEDRWVYPGQRVGIV